MRRATVIAVSLATLAAALPADAQTPIDSALLHYIESVRAIDDHAHPMLPVAPGAPADTDFDALPLGGIPAFDVPARLRPDDPIWRAAQQALYGIPATQQGDAYHAALMAAVADTLRARGGGLPTWVLDRAGIDVMFANRIAMGPGLPSPRFRWIAFADPLMLPLDTRAEGARTPDVRSLYPRESALLKRYLRELGLGALPATLGAYERDVVRPMLARWRAEGAVAIKFEAAYLRPLDFDDPDSAAAARTYASYPRGGVPGHAEYRNLQNYLFRAIVREAGRRQLVTQIHVLEVFGGFYSSHGSAPHLLEPAANDSSLRGARIVVVHGGWPLVGETQGLISKPNVYTDISMLGNMLSPTVLAGVLRQWLGQWPEKVMFGTDAFDGGPEQGWEQVAWVGSTTARRALAIALTGMMRDGEIDGTRARELARMVMRENALRVYALSDHR